MKISREKINIELARKKMTVAALAEAYGVSRARMNVILNSQVVTPVCAGRVASAGSGCNGNHGVVAGSCKRKEEAWQSLRR